MPLVDRYLLRRFFAGYVIVLASLVVLYVLLDVFTKMDDLAQLTARPEALLRTLGLYYGGRLPYYVHRLSTIAALLALLFDLAMLERNNELFPWWNAGISLYRLLLPLAAGVLIVVATELVNRECLLPRCAPILQQGLLDLQCPHVPIEGGYDRRWVHIEGQLGVPERRMIAHGRVTLPADIMGQLTHLTCMEMFYRPPRGHEDSGWYLVATQPAVVECQHPALNWLGPGLYFLHTELSFESLARRPNWFYFASTSELLHVVQREDRLPRRAEILTVLHVRFTEPFQDLVLLIAGVGIFMASRTRSMVLQTGWGLALVGLFQGVQYVAVYFARQEYLPPALAAWLPLLLFGPPALWALANVRT
ncbi:MAG: hypothetical protein C4297_03625 [Gemmataceae bacterium]